MSQASTPVMFSPIAFLETLVVCTVAGGMRYASTRTAVIDTVQISSAVVVIVTYLLIIVLASIGGAAMFSAYDSDSGRFYVVNLIVQFPVLHASALVSLTSVRTVARQINLNATSRVFGIFAFFLATLVPMQWLLEILDHPALLQAGARDAIASAPSVVSALVYVSVPIAVGATVMRRVSSSFRFSTGFALVVALNAPLLATLEWLSDEHTTTALAYMSLWNAAIAMLVPKSSLQAGMLTSGAIASVGFFMPPLFELRAFAATSDAHRMAILILTVGLVVYKRMQTTDATKVGLATLLAVSLALRVASLTLNDLSAVSEVLATTAIGAVGVGATYLVVVVAEPESGTIDEERVDRMILDSV